jgi:hypothetical protein
VNIESKWWVKGGVVTLTLISAIALFYYAGQWPIGPRSIPGWLVYFFCLLGLQRAYAGLFGVVAIIFMPVSPGVDQKR